MADLIDRQAILKHIEKIRRGVMMDDIRMASIIMNGMDMCEEAVTNQPSVDAVPVRRGKWLERNPQKSDKCRLIECSECGKGYIVGFNVPYEDWSKAHKFCVECGADMREVSDD